MSIILNHFSAYISLRKGSVFILKQQFFRAIVLVILSLTIILIPLGFKNDIIETDSKNISELSDIIIIDAGHGGEDGGAIAIDGTLEKDLNLSIALKTGAFLRLLGYNVLFTRESDTMTCDNGLSSQRTKKVSDIKNRLNLIEQSDCKCFLSIHQNFFGGKANGAQVFYGKNNYESQILAEYVQNGISSMLQKDNKREIKKTTDDIYILYRTTKPAILVECGFISDKNDLNNLKDENYQNKIAFSIACSTLNYFAKDEENGKT